jgi:hypothetical protein
MTFVLSALIFVQMNIINNAAKIKEEQFSQIVRRCLMRVSTRLEEQEIKQFIHDEQQKALKQLGFDQGITPQGIIDHKQINFSISMSKDAKGNIKASASVQNSDTVIHAPVQDPEAFQALADLNNWEQERFYQSFQNRSLLNRNIQYQLELANRPIEQRINKEFLEELKSSTADLKQCSPKGVGDHILAASFLAEFVENDVPWVHMDLSAGDNEDGLGHIASKFTGFGVRYTISAILDEKLLEAKL